MPEARRLQGVEFTYADEGEGPVVLFVHGSNTDHRIWAEHGEIISQRYRFLALTQRYFGDAKWPDNGLHFSIEVHADDLAKFIGALTLDPVTIVGWSYGAAVCLAMAQRHSKLVQKLILYEPALATFVRDPIAAKSAADDRARMTSAARAEAIRGDCETAVRHFMDGVNDQSGTFSRLRPAIQQIMLKNARMLPLLFAAPSPQITCEDFGRLEVPVIVALGEESRGFYKIAAEWAAECVPDGTLIIVPRARHLWPVQDPRAFSQLVLNLLDGGPTV